MSSDPWFERMVEDQDDPNNPLFWETLAYTSRMGMDLHRPDVGPRSDTLVTEIARLKRAVALKTPTMMMPVVE